MKPEPFARFNEQAKSCFPVTIFSSQRGQQRPDGSLGFTLIELVITVTVMTILTLGVIPLAQVAIRRQQEQRLRETLREIRSAIDEFHRDTVGMQCIGISASSPGFSAAPDPRSKVITADCTIFGVDNPDRYPPNLEILVNGVDVVPRTSVTGNGPSGPNATDINSVVTKKKIYLRAMPLDPLTGKADWELRSSYDAVDAASWGGENLFDIHSASKRTALNSEKYSDW
ncbi:MAG: type II secretion system protein [Pyrinomonadaceae bacterium]